MAGIGQSSAQSSDQSTPWNSSQFSMGRSTTIDNHSNIQNKYFQVSEKRRLMPEENGVIPQNMYQYSRQATGFQSSNVLSNDKSFLSSLQNPMSSGSNAMNYNMYQRAVGVESNMFQMGNMDMSSQSKQGFNSSSRLSGMSQFLDSPNHSYLSPTPHRTISSGSMNPNVPIFNGQNMSKNRPGSYNLDSHSMNLMNQWETQIGNFDSSEFPSLKTKPNTLQTQMSGSSAAGGYNYNLSNKSLGQINYQLVTKSGMPITPGEHTSEFSIQQEDFPALPVAHNPITCAETQRSSSALGSCAPALAMNSCDNSSQSHNSSVVDSNDFLAQKIYPSNYPMECPDQSSLLMPPPLPPTSAPSYQQYQQQQQQQHQQQSSLSSLLLSGPLSSTNNSSQPHTKVQKKISLGPNNYIANIPNDMVADAFGLVGLVKLLGINDTYENLNLLAPGLETLSLNKELDSTRDIYHSYVSPLTSNCAGRPHDMDYPVPKEYRVRHILIERLADPLPEKLSDETLFWIFYNLTGEECQLTAARQLMNRQWRYNKRERFWLTRDNVGVDPVTHPSFERGSYVVWDFEKAKRVSKQLTVYYKDLENIGAAASTKLQLPFCYNSGIGGKRPPIVGGGGGGTAAAASGSAGMLGPGQSRSKNNLAAFLQQQQGPSCMTASSGVVGGGFVTSVGPLTAAAGTSGPPAVTAPPSSSSPPSSVVVTQQ